MFTEKDMIKYCRTLLEEAIVSEETIKTLSFADAFKELTAGKTIYRKGWKKEHRTSPVVYSRWFMKNNKLKIYIPIEGSAYVFKWTEKKLEDQVSMEELIHDMESNDWIVSDKQITVGKKFKAAPSKE